MTPTTSPELVQRAFEFGYPLVYNISTVGLFLARGFGGLPPTPFNTYAFADELADPNTDFVSVNNDTLYAIAQLDLSGGALDVDVPDTGDRYYVLQFVDAWTNNFAYIGTRATGNRAGSFRIVPPDSDETDSADRTVIAAPTHIVSIVGRIACDGPGDIGNVLRLQHGFQIRPVTPNGSLSGIPQPHQDVPAELMFWEQLRVWSQAFPPAPADIEYLQQFRALGLLDEASPYVDPEPALMRELTEQLAKAKRDFEAHAMSSSTEDLSAWQMNRSLFNYNLDFFEVGTLQAPEWRISDRAEAYTVRAIAARIGLWGNHAYEALYPATYVDDSGRPLNGAHRYELRLRDLPPVNAFWSLTMYDMPDYYLVRNKLDRYSIGDRTPGLMNEPDGSLIITIQNEEPDDAKRRANWLPAPAGDFRPMMRLYVPGPEILGGTYELPPIVKVSP
ncbi:DUF1254 domain-containing protein [Hoyosella sp. YIM 151337]|uniref:DUF1254 domain-containing protein n=1 Tax=Hoyosella sp. YIM 151337 TaxID=2992742 RepID=UPI0022366D57|nr:DUF1254 domain-containing protein [Hoyosella sp. YIM 151337]MCW4353520.1 DUF1254 domain-containing protein [Hoyosella sp. YIM 151337]